MPRLLTKAFRTNDKNELLVNPSTGREGGLQTGFARVGGSGFVCVPFDSGQPLADRKWLLLTFPTDTIDIGGDTAASPNTYRSRGTSRGSGYHDPPVVSDYSNRKQFLRGQYLNLTVFAGVAVCVDSTGAIEEVISLEGS